MDAERGEVAALRGLSLATFRIENIVASASLGGALDLPAILRKLQGAEYEPERFPGLIYRLREPKTTVLLFQTGKVLCTGSRSLDDVKAAMGFLAKRLRTAGIPVRGDPEIEVQNIVATSDLGTRIDQAAAARSLRRGQVEYEPEQFPGLVYRIAEPKVVLLLFGSGKLVCTGARTPADVREAVESIRSELKATSILP